VHRTFANTGSIVLVSLASVLFQPASAAVAAAQQQSLGPFFVVGVGTVCAAAILYNSVKK
jgi:hypothetical protein